ncbi:MAG: threonylcarbamoyl-AMP synthase [Desulfomonile sp.]|nr:threonylcarbamoyl-AMP synthase [Desulfomonile sp.]
MEPLISQAAGVIRAGGLVILPTETFYALAADPWNKAAVKRIFEIKGRPLDKPLPLIAADRTSVEGVIVAPDRQTVRLMDEFWPGSLTILLAPARSVPRLLTDPAGRIGVRVPPDCAARSVAALAGGWLTATSANLSDEPAADRVALIRATLLDAVDLVVDLGRTPGGLPSTVVECFKGELRIIREGAVSADRLRCATASDCQ